MMAMTYKGVPASDARGQIGDLCNRVAYGKERVVITRYGNPLFALVPLQNMATLQRYSEKFGFTLSAQHASIVEVREKFAELCRRVSAGKEIVIVTKSGTPRLALVPLEESAFVLGELEKFLDVEAAQEMLQDKTPENAVGLEEIAQALGIKQSI